MVKTPLKGDIGGLTGEFVWISMILLMVEILQAPLYYESFSAKQRPFRLESSFS